MNGQLEFLDIDTTESVGKETHQLCTDVVWDYTGRFVTTYVSNWKNKNENGFIIWSCRGKKIYSLNKDHFYQFLWRPRPPIILPKEVMESLSQPTVFKKYQKTYKTMEGYEEKFLLAKRRAEQEKLKSDFRSLLLQRLKEQDSDVNWRKSLGIHDDAESDFYVVEECVEEILEEKIEVIET